MTSRWLWMCVLIQTLVAISAASGEPISPATANRTEAVVIKIVPMSAQSVRMAIATVLASNVRFRRHDDDGAPKLVNARIAGPAEVKGTSSRKQPIYCVHVDLILTKRFLWITRDDLEAVVTFLPGENGGQRIQGRVWSVAGHSSRSACDPVPFTPFPELEQLRAKRRHALGRTDP